LTGLTLVGAMASCGASGDGSTDQLATVADSAGIEIVFSPAPVWDSRTSWSVSETPALTIGAAEGDDAYILYGVRAAIRLDDGRIAIANQGLSQVRIYDADGEHVGDLGREGEGPGEFMRLMDLWRAPGDSMVAADYRLGRLTVFDGSGRVGRTIPLQQSETPRQLFGRRTLDDGSILVSAPVRASELPKLGLFDGGIREFDRYSPEGKRLNQIGELPQAPNWGFDSGNPYGPSYTSAPFSIASPPHASDGENVFLGNGARAEVGQWSPGGELLRIIRWAAEPRRVTPELREEYRDMRMAWADTPESRQSTQDMFDGMVFPDQLPVYRTLMADSEGYLWMQPYAAEWESGRDWWVFDRSGQWLGRIVLPDGLGVLEVGRDYVLGVVRDDQDVERVVLYGLSRGPDA
jgi:hypothetical protein